MAYYGGAWRECASRLSKDLKVWLEAKNERLHAKIKGAKPNET